MSQRPNTPGDFWKYVNKTDGCWLWTGSIHSSGYGAWRIQRKQIKAHRYSYMLATGADPGKLLVCHKCDVRSCVRPDHLFLGTTDDNMADMVAKGRSAKGERHGQHKLDAARVNEIRTRFSAGESKKALGRRFGVSDTLIRYIVTGRAWS